jgi:hypothetical protein
MYMYICIYMYMCVHLYRHILIPWQSQEMLRRKDKSVFLGHTDWWALFCREKMFLEHTHIIDVYVYNMYKYKLISIYHTFYIYAYLLILAGILEITIYLPRPWLLSCIYWYRLFFSQLNRVLDRGFLLG